MEKAITGAVMPWNLPSDAAVFSRETNLHGLEISSNSERF